MYNPLSFNGSQHILKTTEHLKMCPIGLFELFKNNMLRILDQQLMVMKGVLHRATIILLKTFLLSVFKINHANLFCCFYIV